MSNSPHSRDDAPVYGRIGNLAVVQLPGRAFPAIAVQGDTFQALVAQAEGLASAILASGVEAEMAEEVVHALARLRAARDFYEGVLCDRGIGLPYTRPRESEG